MLQRCQDAVCVIFDRVGMFQHTFHTDPSPAAPRNDSHPANPSACSDDINIVAVLKAMGSESDQEVVQLIGPDEQLAALLMASIQVGCWRALVAGQVLAAAMVLPRLCVHCSNSKTFALDDVTGGQQDSRGCGLFSHANWTA